jgi:hypothetical protein
MPPWIAVIVEAVKGSLNPDNPSECEMIMIASTRIGWENRLIDYLDL